MEYDPKIIQEYAEGLYKQSRSIATCYFFIGIFAAIIMFGKISFLLTQTFDFLIVAIGVFIGGVVGLFAGKSRAFEMQLEAQQALCQIKIQENTSAKK
ncbi:MAG TPA: hypothetical protein VLJ10_03510 [Candidatus Bathyarchaeia archaeon]|nr:hypothetical protein [Candidatus Bathyarchaeia archaeon]